uniref:Uncharacterized protein n=1 Tax=Opuntia streptacantha TaxID=393608 RepID=A0A7C9EJP9_OPUST
MDVHVHPTRAEDCRVDVVLGRHREHHHPLVAARVDYSVHKIHDAGKTHRRRRGSGDVAVEVFDEDERSRISLEEEELKIRVSGHFRKVEVIDVVGERFRHRCHEARFSGTRGAVKEVASPPDPP